MTLGTAVRPHRSFRAAASLAGVAGIVVLAGCAGTDAPTEDSAAQTRGAEETSGTSQPADAGSEPAAGGAYIAGTYTADGEYLDGRGSVESIAVTLTIDDAGTVEAVEVTGNPRSADSKQYQGLFAEGIAAEVVGKSIDGLEVGIVSGSSLTGSGFNAAVEEIRAEAAS